MSVEQLVALDQGWATGGTRAARGPPPYSLRPALTFSKILKMLPSVDGLLL